MSSINPVYLMPGALAARADALGKAFVGSLTMGAGQFCTNPGLVLAIAGPDLDAFVASASAALADYAPAAMLTPGIHGAYEAGRKALEGNGRVRRAAEGKVGEGVNRGRGALFVTEAEDFPRRRQLGARGVRRFVAGGALPRRRRTRRHHAQARRPAHRDAASRALRHRAGAPPDAGAGSEGRAGILANGWPTGVEVSHAMVHGGPFPATSDGRSTSVGTLAIRRFLRPVCLPGPAGGAPARAARRRRAAGAAPHARRRGEAAGLIREGAKGLFGSFAESAREKLPIGWTRPIG